MSPEGRESADLSHPKQSTLYKIPVLQQALVWNDEQTSKNTEAYVWAPSIWSLTLLQLHTIFS